jgi:hypothetical protein
VDTLSDVYESKAKAGVYLMFSNAAYAKRFFEANNFG